VELINQGLFTLAEAGALLGVPRATLYRKVQTGDIPRDQVVTNLGKKRIKGTYIRALLGVDEPSTGGLPVTALREAAS
jgi:predicted site-specific integrase-resolvase